MNPTGFELTPRSWTNFKGFHEEVQNGVQAGSRPKLFCGRRRPKAVGSALVGTFLGILLAYAFVEPLAGLVEQKAADAAKELQCIKTTLLASMQGYNPSTAIEFGRKVLFSTERPTFAELESHVRGKK